MRANVFGKRMPVWIGALGLLTMAFAVPAAAQGPGAEFVTERAATGGDPENEQLFLFDEAGNLRLTIPLEGREPVVGPTGYFALLGRRPGPLTRVEVFDPDGSPLGTFTVPRDRVLSVGAEAVAVVPYREVPGTEFMIEFWDWQGGILTTHRRPFTLAGLRVQTGGSWSAVSLDENGLYWVTQFDPRGALLWEQYLEGSLQPVVGISGNGRAALGMIHEDLRTSTLVLIDPVGRVVETDEVDAFSTAVFDPEDRYVLLLSRGGVALRNARDGSPVWSEGRDLYPVNRAPAVFSDDGTRFYVVRQPHDADMRLQTPQLATYSIQGRDVSVVERALTEVGDGFLDVVDLKAMSDGQLKLVTSSEIVLIEP